MFKNLAWSIIKPLIEDWLKRRALQLSAVDTQRIAHRLNVPTEVVLAINDEIKASAIAQFEKFKP